MDFNPPGSCNLSSKFRNKRWPSIFCEVKKHEVIHTCPSQHPGLSFEESRWDFHLGVGIQRDHNTLNSRSEIQIQICFHFKSCIVNCYTIFTCLTVVTLFRKLSLCMVTEVFIVFFGWLSSGKGFEICLSFRLVRQTQCLGVSLKKAVYDKVNNSNVQ